MTTEGMNLEYYDDDHGGGDDYIPMTPAFQIVTVVGISGLILIAVVGNVLTICAFITDRKLCTVYDFYIFNLAITDLLIGCSSMPFYAVYTVKEFTWEFGVPFCKIWLTLDFTLCLESVLLMLLLSYDRLLLVKLGPQYSLRCTRKRASVIITISWILAFLLYGPAIITWDYFAGYSTVEPLDCDVEFAQNFEFTTFTAIAEFVLPVVCLAVLNSLVYSKIRGRLRKHSKQTTHDDMNVSAIPTPSNVNGNMLQVEEAFSRKRESKITFDAASYVGSHDIHKGDMGMNRKQKRDTKIRGKRDLKAARFLIILVLVFLTCWAPYTVTTIIVSFCDDCVNTSAYEIMNWLLWGKSAINPFIYAMNSSRYKYNFKRFMCWWRGNKKIHPENVDVTCHTAMS